MNKHQMADLKMMQSLPLDQKIAMSKERIRAWYETWKRYEIYDKETGKTRFVTAAIDGWIDTPPMKPSEYVESVYDGQVYLSFSGGINSTVLKHIIDGMYSDVPAVFVNTGLEYPEIQRFVRDVAAGRWDCFNQDVKTLRPEMRFDEVVKTYGYPVVSKEVANTIDGARNSIRKGVYSLRLCKLGVGREEYGGLFDDGTYDYDGALEKSKFRQPKWRFLLDADFPISSYCCDVMKKRPAAQYGRETGRKAFVANMAEESLNRENAWFKNGCNAFTAKKPVSTPLAFWTTQDFLHYIKKYDVPYCSVYGDIRVKQKVDNDMVFDGQMNMIDYLGDYEPGDQLETSGCDRTGCIFCMFGCHREKSPNRFQRLKQTHPRQYEYCIGGGEMVGGKWQPSKEGLGLGHVLDRIGVDYK